MCLAIAPGALVGEEQLVFDVGIQLPKAPEVVPSDRLAAREGTGQVGVRGRGLADWKVLRKKLSRFVALFRT